MGYVLGLSGGYYHDSSACLVHDGKILAYSEEERWSRRKQHRDKRNSSYSIMSCLEVAGVAPSDIGHVAISWNPTFPTTASVSSDETLRGELFSGLACAQELPRELTVVEHHRAHAASSFYCSGFKDGVVLVVDGSGDGLSTTIWRASERGGLTVTYERDFQHSLGWLYEAATEYVGFPDWASTGKFMALASYGKAVHDFSELVAINSDGYEMRYPFSGTLGEYRSLEYYWKLKNYLSRHFASLGVTRAPSVRHSSVLSEVWEGGLEFNRTHQDFAASIQTMLQQSLAALVRKATSATDSTRVCLAGGVALNCAANGYLSELFPNLELFICPFANDSGGSVGAAMEVSRLHGARFSPVRLEDAGIGPHFSNRHVESVLKRSGLRYFHCEHFPLYVAERIAQGCVVGWFHGAAEAGPRALGHRSILADPRTLATRDRVNRHTKCRETWRPLCPSIAAEYLAEFSSSPKADDFMLVAQRATEFASRNISGVVHVDGTMRCQRVRHETNPYYHELLNRLKGTIGVPAVLNTSFNRRDEPIVGSPMDALRTFISTDLDILSIGEYIVTKAG